jgi:hypothetical protein
MTASARLQADDSPGTASFPLEGPPRALHCPPRVAIAEHLYGRAIDPFLSPLDDEPMSEQTIANKRRSSRAFHKIRVQAQGRSQTGKKFRELCETVVVNAHGGLLFLKNEVDGGEMLVLTNPETQEEQECRIVYLGELGDRGQRVGVEFLTPAPHFWGLELEGTPVAGAVH